MIPCLQSRLLYLSWALGGDSPESRGWGSPANRLGVRIGIRVANGSCSEVCTTASALGMLVVDDPIMKRPSEQKRSSCVARLTWGGELLKVLQVIDKEQ